MKFFRGRGANPYRIPHKMFLWKSPKIHQNDPRGPGNIFNFCDFLWFLCFFLFCDILRGRGANPYWIPHNFFSWKSPKIQNDPRVQGTFLIFCVFFWFLCFFTFCDILRGRGANPYQIPHKFFHESLPKCFKMIPEVQGAFSIFSNFLLLIFVLFHVLWYIERSRCKSLPNPSQIFFHESLPKCFKMIPEVQGAFSIFSNFFSDFCTFSCFVLYWEVEVQILTESLTNFFSWKSPKML